MVDTLMGEEPSLMMMMVIDVSRRIQNDGRGTNGGHATNGGHRHEICSKNGAEIHLFGLDADMVVCCASWFYFYFLKLKVVRTQLSTEF